MNNLINDAKDEIKKIIRNLNSQTACFSGHRSQNLPWRFNDEDERCLAVKNTLRLEILKAIQKNYRIFLCGMAIGFDMLCASTVLELKKDFPDLKLIGALPCKTQEKFWNAKDKKIYREMLTKLDAIRCIYDEYIGAECMIERNKYMVNNSSLLIALYNNISGGTKFTVDYAKKQGLEVVIIKP